MSKLDTIGEMVLEWWTSSVKLQIRFSGRKGLDFDPWWDLRTSGTSWFCFAKYFKTNKCDTPGTSKTAAECWGPWPLVILLLPGTPSAKNAGRWGWGAATFHLRDPKSLGSEKTHTPKLSKTSLWEAFKICSTDPGGHTIINCLE